MQKHFNTQQFWVAEFLRFILNKIPRVMKLSVFLLLCSIGLAQATDSYAQKATVNLEMRNQTVKEVLDEIEEQSDFSFFFNIKHVDLHRRVSVVAKKSDIFKVLETVFAGTDVRYSVVDRKIILSTEKQEIQQNKGEKKITGIVTDQNGEPVIGANVVEKGTTNGTITDFDGKYSLTVSNGNILIVSYIGYKSKEIQIGNNKELNISIEEDLHTLDEVVVVGYGTQKKVNLTGSVASVSSKDLTERVQTNMLSSIQGTVPGVMVVNNPGEGITINFRGRGNLGTSAPLYVIDGIISDATFFSNLNPNSIESISFLKDAASSAIYGARAAYGVVLVTTKKGTENKVSVTYDGYVGMNMPTYLPKTVDSYDYALLLNEGFYNRDMSKGKYQVYSEEQLQKFKEGTEPDYYPNTDWFDLAVRDHVLTTQHSISVSGGTDKLRQFTNVGYVYEDKFQPGESNTRYNFSTNVSSKVTNWLTIQGNVKYYQQNGKREGGSVTPRNLLFLSPTYVAQHSDGTWGSLEGGNAAAYELLKQNAQRTINSGDWWKSKNENTMFDIGAVLSPVKNLQVNAQMVYNSYETKSKTYTSLRDDITNFITKQPVSGTGNTINQMSVSWANTSRLQYILNAQYKWSNDIHDISMLAGTSFEHYKYEALSASRKNFPIDGLEDLNAGSSAGTDITNGGGMSENKLLSYFGRLNYRLLNRYLFEFDFRADASSSFYKDNRWGYFPSVSGGWRISEEPFMAFSKKWLDNLKVRISWGTLGNINNVGYYDYYQNYVLNKDYGYNFDNTVVGGITEVKPANLSLSWEKVAITDIGLDVDLFNGKLSLVADYYQKNTSDILLPYNVPIEVGVNDKPSQNIAKVKNQGFELSISHQHKIGEVSYSIGANMATNKNKIVELSGTNEIINGGSGITHIWRVGEQIGSFYGLKTDGLYTQEEIDAGHYYMNGRVPNAGDIKYLPNRPDLPWGSSIDKNEDRVIIGDEIPDFTYGIHLNLGWKNFEFSALGQGTAGSVIALEGNMYACLPNTPREYQLGRWTVENPNPRAVYPRIYGGTGSLDNYNQTFSDRYLLNGNYFRIKNLTLGYSLPKTIISKAGMSALKVFVTGENLITFRGDKLAKDFDPETKSGYDFAGYGIKSLALGVNVSF